MTTERKARLGTISSGTMIETDLLQSFARELEYLTGNGKIPQLVWDAYDAVDNNENTSDILSELFDALNELAPPYCYFGAHEGDGADYGFWPSTDAIEELPQIGDPGEHPASIGESIAEAIDHGDFSEARRLARVLADCDFAGEDCVFVNDHGNVTIYAADGSIIWDCV